MISLNCAHLCLMHFAPCTLHCIVYYCYYIFCNGWPAKMGLVPFRQPSTLFCCCHLVLHIFCCIKENKPSLSLSLTYHSTHNRSFRDDFYRPDDQTNSVKELKETGWSSRPGLNPRTTPPCYNTTTLCNCLYAHRKGPNVTNPICWTPKNCSYKCC